MAVHIPRCPHCAKSIDVSVTLMERLRFWVTPMVSCPSCSRAVEPGHARIMGNAYGEWAVQFMGELKMVADQLPLLKEVEARRLMGTRVHDEDIHLQQGFDALSRACLSAAKQILKEKAHGQDADLDVAPLPDPATGQTALGAVLAKSSTSTGEKEWEILLARISKTQYVCYLPPASTGIEQRVRDAVQQKTHPGLRAHASLTEHSHAIGRQPA